MISFTGAQRDNLRRNFFYHYNILNANQAPTLQTIQNWEGKFETSNSTWTLPRFDRPSTFRKPENIERFQESLREQPSLSTQMWFAILNTKRIQIVLELMPSDHAKR